MRDGALMRGIPGVLYRELPGAGQAAALARTRVRVMLSEGVAFPGSAAGELPWLAALTPFTMGPELTARVNALGRAVFSYVDAVQQLYRDGHPTVRALLDAGTTPGLRGLDLDRPVQTFRLDCCIAAGRPVATELEEVYGNAGKAHAMEAAYGVPAGDLFDAFAGQGLTHVLVDDQVTTYGTELDMFRRRLAAHGADTRVQFLSQVRPHDAGTAWRFCYTLDLAQYAPDHQQMLTRGRIRYVNPLFHGYGTKLLPAPLFHPKAAPDLARTLGASTMAVLCDGFTGCRPITPADLPDLAEHRRSWVLKVTDSPADRSVTWGSRGVYFGDHSAASWNRVLAAAAASHLPGRPDQPAQYMATRLVESDRYDVPFLHPDGSRGALMTRARIRLAPIFFRDAKGSDSWPGMPHSSTHPAKSTWAGTPSARHSTGPAPLARTRHRP